MYDIAIELVRLGFHGFAVVMLFLGYRLLRAVVGEKASSAAEEITGLQLRLKSVRNFLVISLIFFVLGVASELFRMSQEKRQTNEMTMQLQPEAASMPDEALVPTLLAEDDGNPKPVKMNEATSTFRVKVRDGQRFYLQLHTLTGRVENLTERVNRLLIKQGEENAEGGLDDDL